jgi:hypothetical protein
MWTVLKASVEWRGRVLSPGGRRSLGRRRKAADIAVRERATGGRGREVEAVRARERSKARFG